MTYEHTKEIIFRANTELTYLYKKTIYMTQILKDYLKNKSIYKNFKVYSNNSPFFKKIINSNPMISVDYIGKTLPSKTTNPEKEYAIWVYETDETPIEFWVCIDNERGRNVWMPLNYIYQSIKKNADIGVIFNFVKKGSPFDVGIQLERPPKEFDFLFDTKNLNIWVYLKDFSPIEFEVTYSYNSSNSRIKVVKASLNRETLKIKQLKKQDPITGKTDLSQYNLKESDLIQGCRQGTRIIGLYRKGSEINEIAKINDELITKNNYRLGRYWARKNGKTGYNYIARNGWFREHNIKNLDEFIGGIVVFENGIVGVIDKLTNGSGRYESAYVYYRAYKQLKIEKDELNLDFSNANVIKVNGLDVRNNQEITLFDQDQIPVGTVKLVNNQLVFSPIRENLYKFKWIKILDSETIANTLPSMTIDDEDAGYASEIGSNIPFAFTYVKPYKPSKTINPVMKYVLWLDTKDKKVYICVNNERDNNIWEEMGD